MPLCASPLHQESTLPLNLPPPAFYQRRDGRLFHTCRHCHRVTMRLRRVYGHTRVDRATVRRTFRRYWADWTRRERQANPPLAMQWCSKGHYAPRLDFRVAHRSRRSGFCRDCHAIYQLQWHHKARHGVVLTWEDASARHFQARCALARRRNRQAPPGQRWCGRHQGYYVVPATWATRPSSKLCWCPGCCAAYSRARYAVRKATAQAAAAD